MTDQFTEASLPADETDCIWRFSDFAGFVNLLETQTLRLYRQDRLPPTPGGTAHPAPGIEREIMAALYQAAARSKPAAQGRLERWWAKRAQEDEIERLVQRIRALPIPELAWIDCWQAGDADGPEAERFGSAPQGTLALCSTVGRLRNALALPSAYRVAVHANEAGRTDASGREVRVVATIGAGGQADVPETLAAGIDVALLLQSVTLAADAETWLLTLTQRLLTRYGLTVPCHRAGERAMPVLQLPMLVESA